jgi:hypothetical protein
MSHTIRQTRYRACIDACQACAVACNHCAGACLREPDPKAMAACIALDMDCAQICQLAVAMMARESDHAPALCGLCADVCEACAQECGRHAMTHCLDCALACRRCAEECRKVGGVGGMGAAGPDPQETDRLNMPA